MNAPEFPNVNELARYWDCRPHESRQLSVQSDPGDDRVFVRVIPYQRSTVLWSAVLSPPVCAALAVGLLWLIAMLGGTNPAWLYVAAAALTGISALAIPLALVLVNRRIAKHGSTIASIDPTAGTIDIQRPVPARLTLDDVGRAHAKRVRVRYTINATTSAGPRWAVVLGAEGGAGVAVVVVTSRRRCEQLADALNELLAG